MLPEDAQEKELDSSSCSCDDSIQTPIKLSNPIKVILEQMTSPIMNEVEEIDGPNQLV